MIDKLHRPPSAVHRSHNWHRGTSSAAHSRAMLVTVRPATLK
jgi:hypothetical protein